MVDTDLNQWKEHYSELEFCFFPLKPNSKEPPDNYSWKKETPETLWKIAPADANIAIKCGGKANLLVIDCDNKDNPQTFKNLSFYLSGLGIEDYPVIQTASQIGRHIYLKCSNTQSGSYRNIKPVFGSGEIRFGPGCYVVAPPSIVEKSGIYQIIQGDFSCRPEIGFQDIKPLFIPSQLKEKVNEIPFEKLSRKAKGLLFGKYQEKYPSRSEHEQALILSCINSGLSFDEILFLFIHYPAGGKFQEKYQKNPDLAIRYLLWSYEKAKQYAEDNISEGRRRAMQAMNWADSKIWRGRNGSNDSVVFYAHTRIAYKSGKGEYQASCRELAEIAGMSIKGISNANKRLEEMGFIEKVKSSTCNLASVFRLVQTYTLPHSNNVRECVTLHNHDVFRFHGLGKPGFEIWQALQDGPKTIKELEAITGRHRTTIKRKMEKMSKLIDIRTGEIVSMVTCDGEKYQSKENMDLDYIAELLGTKGLGERQKEHHIREREEHNRQITIKSQIIGTKT